MSFFKNVSKISLWTIASRVGGFVREMMVAYFLGVGIVVDALVLALKFPAFVRRLCAEGTMNTCFVPIFSEILHKKGEKPAKVFAASIFFIFFFALLVVTGLFLLFSADIIPFMFPGLLKTPDRLGHAIYYARIIFPFVVWISMTAIYGAVLNAKEYFSAFAASPFLGNISIIAFVFLGIAFGADTANGVEIGELFAWAILFSGFVQFMVVFLDAWRRDLLLPLPTLVWTPELRSFFRRLFPAAMGAGVAQINLFIGLLIASLLPTGNISYLNYADRLVQLPLSVIGTAMGVVLLPLLVKELHKNNVARANSQQERALGVSSFISFLMACVLILFAYGFVKVAFEHGRFTAHDAWQTARALSAYALGLPAYIMIKILSARFFARGQVVFPLIAGVVGIAVDIVLSLALIGTLGHVGIALATSASAWVNVTLLMGLLRWRQEWSPTKSLWLALAKIVGLSVGSVCVAWPFVEGLFVASLTKAQTFLHLMLGGVGFCALFGGGACILFWPIVRGALDLCDGHLSKKA